MAKEIAIAKRAKISKAQQNMLLAVFGTSIILGAGIALTKHFITQISFNTKVIMAEEESIASYSDIIKNIGICKSPSGSVYSDTELKDCNPDSIKTTEVPNTLRSEILEKIAANKALNSVPKETNSACVDPLYGKNYTLERLNEIRKEANNGTELTAVNRLIIGCSALRIIPDALPSFKNEEALLASLNKIFIESDWQPESISPSGSSVLPSTASIGLNTIPVSLSADDAGAGVITNIFSNIDRSIREFDINSLNIEWKEGKLSFNGQATAYYMDESSIVETTKTIVPEGQ